MTRISTARATSRGISYQAPVKDIKFMLFDVLEADKGELFVGVLQGTDRDLLEMRRNDFLFFSPSLALTPGPL